MRRWLAFILLLASLLLPCVASAEDELLTNGGFETLLGDGAPADWYEKAYRTQIGYSRISVTDEKAHSGTHSASVENASLNDARYTCTVKVDPSSLYRVSAYVLVEAMDAFGVGANIAIEDIYATSEGLFDTGGEWKYIEWYGETGPDQRELTLGVRVGGYGAESVGRAYFDDVSLVKVDKLPDGVTASIWYATRSAAAAQTDSDGEQKSTVLFLLCALAFAALFAFSRRFLDMKPDKRAVWAFWALMAVGLALRLALAAKVPGYQVDINCFTAWSLRIAEVGPAGFYAEGYFCDYPPGYILLLWPFGLLLRAAGYQNTAAALLIVKAAPLICDMLGALLLYAFCKKRAGGTAAAALAALYLLNPATLVNGAAWGQADSVLALLMMITAIYAMNGSWRVALPMFILSALMKPQALLYAPVGAAWLAVCLIKERKSLKKPLTDVAIGLGIGLAVCAAIVLPFSIGRERPLEWLIGLYGDTISSYNSATLNTANLYYLAGANWTDLAEYVPRALPIITAVVFAAVGVLLALPDFRRREARWYLSKRSLAGFSALLLAAFMGVISVTGASYGLFGYGMMAFVFVYALACFCADGRAEALPLYMAIALIGVYVLGVKIHERYLFTAIGLLLLGYASTRDRRALVLMLGFSITTFINTAVVLDNSILYGASMGHLNSDTLTLNIMLCVANIALAGYAGYTAACPQRERRAREVSEPLHSEISKSTPKAYEDMLLSPRDARMRLSARDYLIMGVTSVLYGVLAFYNLGSTVAPQDGWISTSAQEQIVFELDEATDFKFMYYAGVSYNPFSIAVSDDGESWSVDYPCDMKEGLCFRWNYALQSQTLDGIPRYASEDPSGVLWLSGKYIRLNACDAGLNLFEIIARGKDGASLPLKVTSHTGANQGLLDEAKPAESLIDEQDTCVGEPSWFNGMYFDEIYHARTGYEHLHGLTPYETTHPPLGKLFMSAGIAIFGMTPFGWRFSGAFIGILMLPALYLLAMQLTKKRSLAVFSMLAFALDLMHFAQTRIATIDSFPVFFIILTYLCMARYLQADTFAVAQDEQPNLFSRAYIRSLIPLALCGAFMGMSIASKWIGIYSAVGLALLFAAAVYRQFRAGLVAFNYDTEAGGRLTDNQRLRVRTAQDFALRRIFVTCGFCVLFFIIVPCIIYYLSYIPYLAPTGPVNLRRIISAQEGMFRYHSKPGLGADHFFTSPWWQWPFIMKPMWFWQDHYEPEGFASTIMCMGNPWIYYIGIFCILALLAATVAKYVRMRGGIRLRQGDGNLSLAVVSVGFLAQYLPWMLVPRGTYMYHYFASVPFIILASAWAISHVPDNRRRWRSWAMAAYLVIAAAFFVFYYPYASGALTSVEWMDAAKGFFAWPSGLAQGLNAFFKLYY